jgi:hypothetical protein
MVQGPLMSAVQFMNQIIVWVAVGSAGRPLNPQNRSTGLKAQG